MGFMDFIKDAGKAVDGVIGLTAQIEKTGTKIGDLNLDVDGDKVTISGKVQSQEAKEKILLAIGNISGIAQVEDTIEVKNPQQESTFYTVKSGDSLSKISKTVYGDSMKYNFIFKANQPMLESADKIYPGQVLRIPVL